MASDSEFKIEKGIPAPLSAEMAIRRRYPLAEMQSGDSFLVPLNGESREVVRQRLTQACAYANRKWGFKLCTRKTDDGIRVWRIA